VDYLERWRRERRRPLGSSREEAVLLWQANCTILFLAFDRLAKCGRFLPLSSINSTLDV
jgi:hypothetical protein